MIESLIAQDVFAVGCVDKGDRLTCQLVWLNVPHGDPRGQVRELRSPTQSFTVLIPTNIDPFHSIVNLRKVT